PRRAWARHSVSASVSASAARPCEAGDADTDADTLWRAQAGVRYEIDLFGRVESTVSAATASNQRDEALFRSLLLALQADVAQTWLTIRELDAEQALYANAVELRAEALHLMERRFEEGFTSELDVARSRTELATAQSESLAVARRRTLAEHALALLLGKTPAEFRLAPDPLLRVAVRVPAGVPSELLERRPDIAAAERAMAAANARIGAARAAFFPSLVLTGAAGYESASLGDLLDWSSRAFVLGPVAGTIASLPIFDGGRRQANLDRSRAQWEEEVANYRQTVLTAFREVEDHLASLDLLDRRTAAQNEAVTAARRAATLSRIQYREGDVGYLDVIEAERNVLQQQRVAVQIDAERARSVVGLIRATGGSWDTPSVPATTGDGYLRLAGETRG
ncbi:MAG: efflux transporter outer membrane subunit, partial [Azoarcus sp.]|nr:efflux transporter outer membrane subunit [Azoarcus sp.]